MRVNHFWPPDVCRCLDSDMFCWELAYPAGYLFVSSLFCDDDDIMLFEIFVIFKPAGKIFKGLLSIYLFEIKECSHGFVLFRPSSLGNLQRAYRVCDFLPFRILLFRRLLVPVASALIQNKIFPNEKAGWEFVLW